MTTGFGGRRVAGDAEDEAQSIDVNNVKKGHDVVSSAQAVPVSSKIKAGPLDV